MTDAPKITQEMINLYDEYTHITLDRRAYMKSLTALVGTTSAALAVTSLIEADKAAAQMVPENDPRVKGQMVKYPGEGGDFESYVAVPAKATGKIGTVIVVHENRGLTPHIKDVARRLALEGFLAIAPDYLSQSGGTPADEEVGRQVHSKLDPKRVQANSLATLKFAASHASGNGKVGAVGFCWGGATVNQLAVDAGSSLRAAVPYYGRQPKPEDVSKIKAELMLHYASNDPNINKGIDAYKAALDKAGVKYQVFQYENTQHAFNNDASAARYNKAAAETAWKRTVELFKRTLA